MTICLKERKLTLDQGWNLLQPNIITKHQAVTSLGPHRPLAAYYIDLSINLE